ncbi:MAG: hypothetical protein AAF576_08925 [Pseudomonadota bacterium]
MVTAATSPTALGPYTAWMFGAGRGYDFFSSTRQSEPHYLSGIIERPGGHAPTATPQPISGGGVTGTLLAPTLWAGLSAPRFVPFVLGGPLVSDLDSATLDAMWQNAGPAGVTLPGGAGLGPAAGSDTRIGAGFPLRQDIVDPAATGAVTLSADPAVDATKPLVVLGIIDDGIPFAHRAFDGPNGRSRVDACWMQGMPGDGSGRVRFGREVTGDDIATLRATHGEDEDAIYRAAGALGGAGHEPSAIVADASHGAHTLGALAAGGDVQTRIIAVDLPPAATWDTSGYGKDMFMLAGLHYIFDRAEKLAAAYGVAALPMVINISYGYSGGSHDGSATLEAAMDELIEARRAVAPTGFTLPAGNMFVDRTHAQVSLDAGATMDPLPWRLPPDDRTSTFMELWLPPGLSPSDLEITLHGPGATFGPPGPVAATLNGAAPGRLTVTDVTWNGGVVGQLSADEGRTGRWRILAALAPTEVSLPGHAPAGLWHIAIKDTRSTGPTQSLRFWIQRDLSYGRGNTGARQSYFDEPKNRLVDPSGRVEEADTPGAATQRYGSLNGMATGATTLVVGAAQGNPDASPGFKPELYTSASQPADPEQVDLSAMVSANAGETGRLGLTARSGPRARMTGTSASSPAVGAALAKIIEAQPAGPEPTNYLDALKAANAIKPSAPKHTPRLGAGIIKDD